MIKNVFCFMAEVCFGGKQADVKVPSLFWIKNNSLSTFFSLNHWISSSGKKKGAIPRTNEPIVGLFVKHIWCYIKTKSFQMTQGGFQVIIILLIKSKMAAAKKQCFLWFQYLTESSPLSFKVRGLQMTINSALV